MYNIKRSSINGKPQEIIGNPVLFAKYILTKISIVLKTENDYDRLSGTMV